MKFKNLTIANLKLCDTTNISSVAELCGKVASVEVEEVEGPSLWVDGVGKRRNLVIRLEDVGGCGKLYELQEAGFSK